MNDDAKNALVGSLEIETDIEEFRSYHVRLGAREIKDLLRAGGLDVPDSAIVTVAVPSGGDYSGMELEIGADATVDVRWGGLYRHERR